MAEVYLAQNSEHQQLDWIDDGIVEVILDSAATGGQLAAMRSALPPGAASPVHVHGNEDEIFLLLQGSMTCWVADDRYELEEGGVAFLPRAISHAYRAGDRGAQLLTLCTPGGLEGFFREAGHDRSTPRPDGWTITPGSMGAALATHGGRIVGPPKGPDD